MKIILLVLGVISFVLGFIGALLPVMPTVPFLLFSLYCFSKSSPKLRQKMVDSKLYKEHLKDFVEKRELSIKKKIICLAMITTSFACTAIFVNIKFFTIALIITLVCIYCYFIFGIKNSQS